MVLGFCLCVIIFALGAMGFTLSIIYDISYGFSDASVDTLIGNGTSEAPYLIRCGKELLCLEKGAKTEEAFLSGKYAKVQNNIVVLPFMNIKDVQEQANASFSGTLDGDNHLLVGLKDVSEAEYAGMFRALNGTVKNLRLCCSSFKGVNAGGIAGVVGIDGLIKNVSVNGSVKTSGECAGALTGVNYGRIINCTFDRGAVGKTGELGEVAGFLSDGKSTRFMEYPEPVVKNIADDFDDAYVKVILGDATDRIRGFYNYLEDTWCFVRPKSDDEWRLCFIDDRSNYEIDFDKGTKKAQFEYNGNTYNVNLFEYNDTPSLFLKTIAKNGRDYIYEDKANTIAALGYCINEDGIIDEPLQITSVTGRGNDSFQNDLEWKNGFSITFDDRHSVFGLEDNDDYLLLPGYRYSSLLAYAIEKDLFSEVHTKFAPEYRLVQLYMNDEYMGLYMLTDSMEIDKNRFDLIDSYAQTKSINQNKLAEYKKNTEQDEEGNITKVYYDIPNTPKDITGGYILELDLKDYPDSRSRFVSAKGVPLSLKSNNYASNDQLEYVYNFWDDFEKAVISPDGFNSKGKYYADYIDIDSMADLTLQLELSCDISFLGSIYFYKDSDELGDGKLHAANHWDLERSYSDVKLAKKKSFIMDARYDKFVKFGLDFWLALYGHEDFRKALKDKWFNNYSNAVELILADGETYNKEGVGSINYYLKRYEESAVINSNRWPGCAWYEKGESIREFLTIRKDLLDSDEFWENCLEHEEE